MKIVEISDKAYDDFLPQFNEVFARINNEHVVVGTSYFFDRISEKHRGIIFYHE